MSTPASPHAAVPAPPPAPATGAAALRLIAADIKLSHTVFALPFAVLGAFLARSTGAPWSRFAGQMLLVLACMVTARTWAMLVNRLADRRIDATNPRTARRVFASGKVSPALGAAALITCAVLFILSAAGFWLFYANPWPTYLALPVLAYLALYSYTKRFTWLCHLYLGVALCLSPMAAALAVDPASLTHTHAIFWLAAMVALWVAGFDIIYALQDVDTDVSTGLWSVPSRLGIPAALTISRALHAGALACLTLAWKAEPRLGTPFAAAIILVAGLLITEHVVLARRGKAGLDLAFFTLNGIVSCVLGIVGVADLLS